MRSSSSHHIEILETHSSDIWHEFDHENFRPLLNIRALCDSLEALDHEPAPSSSQVEPENSKKRSREFPVRSTRPSKRAKTAGGSNRGCEAETVDEVEERPAFQYPILLPVQNPTTRDEDEALPVLQHLFDIQYEKKRNTGLRATSAEWAREEQNFVEMLVSLQSTASEPRVIHLGEVELVPFRGRLVVTMLPLNNPNNPAWTVLLPILDQDIDLAWHDISFQSARDVMMASSILQSAGRASIQSRLNIIILPHDSLTSAYPFHLQLTITVSFITPTIFEPFPRADKKKNTVEVEDAHRRVCEYIWPSSVQIPDSYHGSTNIPYFYSVLRAAPPSPSIAAFNALQPPALAPTLLPFQRRSVAWLLGREGKLMTHSGDIVLNAEDSSFSFWDRIEVGNRTWYLNRLSGVLSPSPPSPPPAPVLGGILAEEPGLGKTLETIALIMLNPAPLERNPSVKRWDPEARLEVSAIKTTLIVTPPALASQWADELAAHAPLLKVMIYDGWSKVPVPITKSQIREAKRKILKSRGIKPPSSQAKLTVTGTVRNGKLKIHGRNKDELASVIVVDMDGDVDMSLSSKTSASANGEEGGIEVQDWLSYVSSFDVVIVTYPVLRADFNVAHAAPLRPRRADVTYSNVDRPRSPLVMCEWYRVVMDEVQMVGGGKTEDMVSLIPRLSSLAVSGTPARSQVADLMHVLKFLRVDNLIGSAKLWNRLTTSGFAAGYFAAFFQTYAIRTLKADVKDELTIPQQTRYLVSIPLGPVEKHVYDQALERALLDLGLDARGVAASYGWQLDSALLRTSLRKLRGICTHPQVGQLQIQGDKGIFKPGAVKTIEDVLQNMVETNWRTMMDDQKSKVQTLIRMAQLQYRDEGDRNRVQHALHTLLQAEKEALALAEEIKAALDRHKMPRGSSSKKISPEPSSTDKGKGKQRAVSEDPHDDMALDSDEGSGHSAVSEEHRRKRGALRSRFRECRLTLHRVKFFQGDMYHCLGEKSAADEDAAYEAAGEIRRELLKGSEEDAIRAMALLEHDATRKGITLDALLIDTMFVDDQGMAGLVAEYKPTRQEMEAQQRKVTLFKRAQRSLELITEGNDIMNDVLNQQSALLWEWRTHMIGLLTQKLSQDDEDKADGEEYQRTLENQGEAETYIQCYAALLSDRRQALLNERTLLAEHNVREKKKRQTKAARQAEAAEYNFDDKDDLIEMPEDVEMKPEHEELLLELSTNRKILFSRLGGRAVKSVLIDLNATATAINGESDPEKLLLKDIIAKIRQFISDQTSLMEKLEADLTLIRKAFNQRILYFRQLQEISDSVAEVIWNGTVLDALTEATLDKEELEGNVNRSRARQRYLDTLARKRNEGVEDEDDEGCILCRCEFVRGYITHCAHMFCEGCLKAWLLRKEGKTCPVCRVAIDPNAIQRFSVNERQPEPPSNTGEPVPKSRRQIAYNMIDSKILDGIETMESYGDYGSKIQTLIRHLLYLKFTDVGAKSIVFSAWADSLHILERALKENGTANMLFPKYKSSIFDFKGLRCLRIDQKSKGENAAKMFKNNPDILVLLLHGERENAGLNITCASRVFLLESVVHHGFELQAIARIDRMGQSRPTEVYCYYAEDTVERNILDLAARKGLSLYTKDNAAGTLSVSSLDVNAEEKIDNLPKKKTQKKGDFIFKLDDMLAILFPHMYEEIEFLIPPDGIATNGVDIGEGTPARNGVAVGGSRVMNAVAGPSRLS